MPSDALNLSTRKTVADFPRRFPPDQDYAATVYARGFANSVQSAVLPYLSGSGPNYEVRIHSSDEARLDAVQRIFHGQNAYRRGDTRSDISDFVREVAWLLAYKGGLHYEIFLSDVNDETGAARYADDTRDLSIPNIKIGLIPGNVLFVMGTLYQVLPPSFSRKRRRLFIRLPKSSVWSVCLPRAFGSSSDHKRMLAVLSEPSLPKGKNPQLHFYAYSEQMSAMRAKFTRKWGWDANGAFRERSLDYYSGHRRLTNMKAMALLREHILQDMNKLLERIGYSERIEIVGLPTISALDEFEKRFTEGAASLRDVYQLELS